MSMMLKQKLIDIANGFTKYGLWKGGSSALSGMTDVTFTDLQANDVLTYNGSEWVNDDNLQTQINTLNNNLVKKVTGYFSSGVLNNCKIGYQTIVLDFSTSEKLKTFSIESDIKALLCVITSLSTGFTTLKPIVAIQSIDNENKTFTVAYSADAEFTINVHCLLFGA